VEYFKIKKMVMKYKIKKLVNSILNTSIISLLFYSCNVIDVDNINIKQQYNYPVLSFSTTSGSITVAPVTDNIGSIGYKLSDSIHWLKGLPAIEKKGKDKLFIWQDEILDKVILAVNTDNNDYILKLNNTNKSNIKPESWLINIKAGADEYFTGIAERVVDGHQNASWKNGISTAINLRGEIFNVKLNPTVSAYAPFFISSNNYGFFVKGTWPGKIDFCSTFLNIVQISFEGPELNFKFYTGKSPMEIVQKHSLETGPSFIPPKWALGPWRWRDEHFNRKKYYDSTEKKAPYNTDIVEDVLMMEAFDIPVTAFWIDRPYCYGSRGYDDFEFDTTKFPQIENMIKWLNSKNYEIMIWIAPWVMGKIANEALEKNYHLQSMPERDLYVLMDFTNDEACKWWAEKGPGKLAKMGFKGFKLDRGDGEILLDSLNLKTYTGTTYRENYNDYARQFIKATYDAVKPILGNNFILFQRTQYTGSSKYGGMWAGDTDGKPEGLRSVIIGMQRCAVMGYPLWGSDIGGYWGQFSQKTTMRWLGFGCFSPLMEVGPTNNLAFWSNPSEPKYNVELIATWRLYSKIRMKLIPYIEKAVKESNTKGTPIVRPLFLAYPEQKESWNDWQTYMFGPDILISAPFDTLSTKHKLYLPANEKWIDAWNPDVIYNGGKYIEVDAPLYKIPIFIKSNSKINLGNLNDLYRESIKLASKKPDLTLLEQKEGWK
jgi:alpha-D-xyloside xylohydrolase